MQLSHHDLKKDLAMYCAVLAAGFGLSNIESVATHDGSCWSTVLTFEKKKVLRASNGGFGGPDEIEQLIDKEGRMRDLAVAKPIIDKLMSIPEVASNVRDFEIDLEVGTWHYAVERTHSARVAAGGAETLEQTRESLKGESDGKVEQLQNGPLRYNDETVARIVGALTDIRSNVTKMRRVCKTGVAWFKKGAVDGTFVTVKVADSAAARARLEVRYGAEMDGYIADAIAGL
jgi:hypothetical protein